MPILFNKSRVIPHKYKLPFEIEEFRIDNFLFFYEEFIKRIKSKEKFVKKFQPNYLGRYNPRLNSSISGWVDWNLDSYDLINFINAFEDPYKGASTHYKSKRVYIKGVQVHGGEISTHPYLSGLITRVDKNWLIVSTNSGQSIIIEKVLKFYICFI